MVASERKARPLWRSVALPPEHGSWGLVAEPLLLALMVKPSPGGAVLALGVLAGFLAYRPLKLLYGDLRRGRRFQRTRIALAFASGLAALCVALLVASVDIAGVWPFLAFLIAAPFALIFVVYDLAPGRFWQAEVAAPVAFASSAAAVALAGAGSWRLAVALWAVVTARSLSSVLYVRARLRLERGEPARTGLALVAHVLGLFAVACMVAAGWLPALALLAMALLLVRAGLGLSRLRRRVSARAVGLSEIGWGIAVIVIVAVGFWFRV